MSVSSSGSPGGQGPLALAARGLEKSYGATRALAGLELAVPQGVVYGFLGPNGAGKTTTIRCLLGLIRPDGGRMELFDKPFGSGRSALSSNRRRSIHTSRAGTTCG